jgi:hypothetical protein
MDPLRVEELSVDGLEMGVRQEKQGRTLRMT